MARNRRTFLKSVAGAGALTVLGADRAAHASAGHAGEDACGGDADDQVGVLVDCTRCVGCRRCEKACNQVNEDLPCKDPEEFKDKTVFEQPRRMDAGAYTVVNRWANPSDPAEPTYAKIQCMHCLYPACVSACIVGALQRQADGAVTYDAAKCIGCRYCMAACPFQVPAYEYGDTLTPEVRKCTFCFQTRLSEGKLPACVQACPMQVMTFGRREELIRLGRERLRKHPRRYVPQIYGEKEVGGTSWMYLSNVPFADMGFPKFGYHPVPGFTEPIQHALFKWFIPPLALYGTLGGVMWLLKSRRKKTEAAAAVEDTHDRS